MDYLWGKVKNTGNPKGKEPKNWEFLRGEIRKLHRIREGLADF